MSDVRTAYAEVMLAALTEDTTVSYSKDSAQIIHKSNGIYSVLVSPLHQEQDNWQTSAELNIGGISSADTTHWIGTPTAKGSCEVSYQPQNDSVILRWSGKAGNNSNNSTENNGNSSGGNSTPAPNPGGGSASGSGDNLTGGSTGGSDINQGNTGNSSNNSSASALKDFNSGSWPPDVENTKCDIHLQSGQVVSYDNHYFVWAAGDYTYTFLNNTSNSTDVYATPTSQMYEWMFIKVTDKKIHFTNNSSDSPRYRSCCVILSLPHSHLPSRFLLQPVHLHNGASSPPVAS